MPNLHTETRLHPEAWPVIDYRAHPAFSFAPAVPGSGFEQDVEGLVLEANQALDTRYAATERLPDLELTAWLNAHLGPPIDRLRQLCAAVMPKADVMTRCVDAALRGMRDDASAEATFRNKVARRGTSTESGPARAALLDLETRSIAIGRIDDRQIQAMADDLRPQMAILRDCGAARRGTRAWRTLPRAGRYFRVLNEALASLGYLEASSAFYGCEMDLLSSSLVYSHEREIWWRDCYRDRGLPTSPAAYFHHDQDWHQIKAVLYLTPATRETGAFSYIEGGHHFRPGNALAHFYFHLVHAMGRAASETTAGLAGYYRRGFSDPALRAAFVALPRALQGATHFGDDLHVGDPQTAALLARERVVESSAGNVVLFNGSDLFHRGGLVQKGERWSLQLMFGPRVTRSEQLRTRAQHLALVAASRAIGWRNVDRLRALRRGAL